MIDLRGQWSNGSGETQQSKADGVAVQMSIVEARL
jgi:hypothetical protein